MKSSIKINTSMKETGTKVKTEVTDTLAQVTEQLVKKGNSQKKKIKNNLIEKFILNLSKHLL